MEYSDNIKMVKRLNTTLPDPLAYYVGAMTADGGMYETPSEFIRDLVRRHMEKQREEEEREIDEMLAQSIAQNDHTPWTQQDMDDLRAVINDE